MKSILPSLGLKTLWLLSANYLQTLYQLHSGYDSTYKVQLIRGGRVKEGSFCFMQCATQCSCSLLGQHRELCKHQPVTQNIKSAHENIFSLAVSCLVAPRRMMRAGAWWGAGQRALPCPCSSGSSPRPRCLLSSRSRWDKKCVKKTICDNIWQYWMFYYINSIMTRLLCD